MHRSLRGALVGGQQLLLKGVGDAPEGPTGELEHQDAFYETTVESCLSDPGSASVSFFVFVFVVIYLCWFHASPPFLFLFRTFLSSRGCCWSVMRSSEKEHAAKGTDSHSRRKRMISNFLWLGKWERWHPSSGSISWPSRRRDRIFRSTRPSYPWS